MALATAGKTLKATYKTPFQMHGSIGPSCAVADVKRDRATFWSCTQMPHETRRDMARLLGMPLDSVELRWFEGAGGYGRNGLDHVVADAAICRRPSAGRCACSGCAGTSTAGSRRGRRSCRICSARSIDNGRVIAWRHHSWIPTTERHASDRGGAHRPADLTGEAGLGRPSVTYAYHFRQRRRGQPRRGPGGAADRLAALAGAVRDDLRHGVVHRRAGGSGGQDPLAFRLAHLGMPVRSTC